MTAERSIANGWERLVASDWLRRLDAAQASTYEQAMRSLRKQRNSEGRAEDAFAVLLEGLTGGTPPDYNDPFVAVSYLIQYQLNHCAMAFAVWWNFFDQHGVPSRLSVFDFGAGSGAGAVGLQLALVLRKSAGLPYVLSDRLRLGAYEPSEPMRDIGERFLRQLRLLNPNYWGLQNLREWEHTDSVLEVTTAFHPALPWDTEGVGLDAIGRDFQRTMNAIRPDIVLGTCYTNKEMALRHLLGESNISEVATFPVDGLADFSNWRSSFFWNSVPIKDGFEDPRAAGDPPKSLKWRSRFRFSLPQGPLLEKPAEGYIPPVEFAGKPWSRTGAQAIANRQRQQEQERIERLAERRRRQEAERREKAKQAAERLRREQELQQERERQEKEERERPLWDELESLLASDSVFRCKLDGRLRHEGHSATWNGLSGFVPKSELGDLNSVGIGRTHFRGQDLDFILTAVNRGVEFTASRSQFLERRRQEQQQAAAERQARELAKWEPLTAARSSGEPLGVNLLHRTYNRQSGQVSGWTVSYQDLQGFMPYSQSGEYRDSVDGAIQDVSVVVLEVELPSSSRPSGNFVVSRRKVLDTQQSRVSSGRRQSREAEKQAAWEGFSVAVGDGFAGEVSGVTDFGVFVRLESGVEGLSHISQLGGSDNLSQFFVGQRVLVSVVSVDRDRMRLGLRIASG